LNEFFRLGQRLGTPFSVVGFLLSMSFGRPGDRDVGVMHAGSA
jgi:hypothetical protein